MSTAREILQLFEDNGLGEYDVNLFENDMPETPNTCGAVYATSGTAPDGGFGVDGIQYEHPGLQVRFRGEPRNDAGPEAQAQAAYRLLMRSWAQTLSSTKYLTLKPTQSPFILERDGNARTVWAFNALLEKELS